MTVYCSAGVFLLTYPPTLAVFRSLDRDFRVGPGLGLMAALALSAVVLLRRGG